jgi:hypothetical protein
MSNGLFIYICITKYLRISSYIRKPFLIRDFAAAPIKIFLYMRKIFFSFYQCTCKYFRKHFRLLLLHFVLDRRRCATMPPQSWPLLLLHLLTLFLTLDSSLGQSQPNRPFTAFASQSFPAQFGQAPPNNPPRFNPPAAALPSTSFPSSPPRFGPSAAAPASSAAAPASSAAFSSSGRAPAAPAVGRTGCALFIPGAASSSTTTSGQQPCILYEVGGGQIILKGDVTFYQDHLHRFWIDWSLIIPYALIAGWRYQPEMNFTYSYDAKRSLVSKGFTLKLLWTEWPLLRFSKQFEIIYFFQKNNYYSGFLDTQATK